MTNGKPQSAEAEASEAVGVSEATDATKVGALDDQSGPSLNAGFMISRDYLTHLLGEKAAQIDPKVFNFWPQGHYILVAVDLIPETTSGGLHLTDTTREQEQLRVGAGVVLSAGPLVGTPCQPPGGIAMHPAQLLGKHVYFSSFVGTFVKLGFSGTSKEFPIQVALITDRDIWLIDTSPPETWFEIE